MSINRVAPAPTKATTSVTLTAGLITIPLSLFTSVESTTVIRKEFVDGDPFVSVGRVAVRKDTGAVIDTASVTRMAQAADGTWVVLTDDEIGTCVGMAGACDIVSFVPIKDAGQYMTDGLYQARPKADKRGASGEAAFSLLLAGMTARKVHALVRFALRGTPRYGLLSSEGDLFMIATADGIRQSLPLPAAKHTKAAVDMVVSLIDAIGVEAPVVVDDAASKVQAYVNGKAKANGVTAPAAAPPAAPVIVDIMSAIEASIANVKSAKPKSTKKVAA